MAKVSDAELVEINQLQSAFSALTTHLGELHVQRIMIDGEIEKSEAIAKEFTAKQSALLQQLQSAYGVGTVNMETGDFVPSANKST